MFMVDRTVKVHMEQTLESLLVGHAWREKRKTSSWPDEHALWPQLCWASYGASIKTLNCVGAQVLPAHPWLQHLWALSVYRCLLPLWRTCRTGGVVMGTERRRWGEKKYKYCTDWSPEPVTAACQAYSERYSESASSVYSTITLDHLQYSTQALLTGSSTWLRCDHILQSSAAFATASVHTTTKQNRGIKHNANVSVNQSFIVLEPQHFNSLNVLD